MNMCGLRFPLQSAFKHLLRCNILATIQFNNAAIVERVSIPWQHAFGSQSSIRNSEIRACPRCYFRDLKIFFQERAKLIACLTKTAACKFLMCSFEGL